MKSVSYLVEVRDKFSRNMVKFAEQADKSRVKVEKLDKKLKSMGNTAVEFGKKMVTRFTLPVAAGFGILLRNAAKMETMRTGFLGILGDADKAAEMVAKLNEFTAKTPFQLEQVSKAGRQLLAAGVPVEEISDKLQFLGDIAAVSNVPLTDMSSIFAKIKNKGKAMTEEILQLSDRGIPAIALLSKEFGVNESAIFDMASKGKISFQMIEQAMINMTKKGGFAHGAMINQSKTLSGVISTLKDNFVLTTAAIGNEFLPEAKAFARIVINVLQRVHEWVKNNRALTKAILTVVGAAAVAIPAIIAIGTAVAAVGFIISNIGIVAIMGALVMAAKSLYKNWDKVNAGFSKFGGIIKGAFKTAVDFVKGALDDFLRYFNIFDSFFKKYKSDMATTFVGGITGQDSVSKAMFSTSRPQSQSVELNGNITVSADKGSKVSTSNFGFSGNRGRIMQTVGVNP